jgi:hypothetical protein
MHQRRLDSLLEDVILTALALFSAVDFGGHHPSLSLPEPTKSRPRHRDRGLAHNPQLVAPHHHSASRNSLKRRRVSSPASMRGEQRIRQAVAAEFGRC